jgi:uncharacterized protein (TIGR00725 family)
LRAVQIAVVGPAEADTDLHEAAAGVGRALAEAGARVVCGGLGGVMEAAARGAREAGGDVIGVLPSADPADANPHVTHVVATGAGQARNVAVVASADAVVALGGSWGTLSEIAHARRLGRPVIALAGWELSGPGTAGLIRATDAPDAAASALAAARDGSNDV